jgi:iron complex outermembrane receptor protein
MSLGAFYFSEKAETLNPQTYFGGGTDLQSDYGSHTKAFALYAQLDYKLTDSLQGQPGRALHARKEGHQPLFPRQLSIAANGIFDAAGRSPTCPTASVPRCEVQQLLARGDAGL